MQFPVQYKKTVSYCGQGWKAFIKTCGQVTTTLATVSTFLSLFCAYQLLKVYHIVSTSTLTYCLYSDPTQKFFYDYNECLYLYANV